MKFTIQRPELINLMAHKLWVIDYVVPFNSANIEERQDYYKRANTILEIVELYIEDGK